jgi:hypothetical protein
MKYFKVELTNQRTEIISARDNDTPEAWLRDAPSKVALNGTAYPKEQIVRVAEYKATKSSTNIDNI